MLVRVKTQMKRQYSDWCCVCFIILTLLMVGCATVKPYEREYLADPLMNYESANKNDAYEQHMHRALAQGLHNARAEGGGCGCEQ